MTHQRGEVVLVPFPFSDLSTTKVRPAIVVSCTAYHEGEPDLLLAAITSNLVAASGSFDYTLEKWREAGLKFPSALKPVLFTLDPQRVIHRIGVLHNTDLIQIDQRLRLALGLEKT